MKKYLVPLLCVLLLAACNSKPANVNKVGLVDVISVSDNGVTYRDTLPAPNGVVTFVSMEDTATEENSTGRFAPAGHKNIRDITDSFIYSCNILKSTSQSTFTLIYSSPASNLPVRFAIINAAGPKSGLGTYKARSGDAVPTRGSSQGSITSSQSFISYAGDAQKYTVDSAVVNVTKADGGSIEGTFQMWVTSAAGSKSITGTINCNVPGDKKYAAR